ncbi:Transcription factor bHLH106 [Hirschfeldia incana]|nr:Transcription factor bHLH106 [Hirschfeldia incana]
MQPESSDQMLYSFLAGNEISRGGYCGSDDYMSTMQSLCGSSSSTSSYYPLAISGIGETMAQDRALAALRNHKEAERRRRERINSHLNKLRNVLSCNSKTDKATLLAKVVQRVKELKQQTLKISESDQTLLPSETDAISVRHYGDYSNDGHIIFKASLCCDDRSDLLPDLMEILKSLHMKTLRAEIVTLGGRTRSVLVVAAEKEMHGVESVHFLQNALKSLLERSSKSLMERSSGGAVERSKRRRALDQIIMV